MLQEFITSFVFESGIKASIVKKVYLKAYKECKALNKHNDLDYIKETMEVILDIKEGTKTCAEKFMQSSYSNFEKFVEDLIDCELDEELLSTSFSTAQKPEIGPDAKPITIGFDDNDTEENRKNKQQQDEI